MPPPPRLMIAAWQRVSKMSSDSVSAESKKQELSCAFLVPLLNRVGDAGMNRNVEIMS